MNILALIHHVSASGFVLLVFIVLVIVALCRGSKD